MRIPWRDKVRNEEVLKRAGAGRKLILEIRTKQMRFLGHLMRKDGLENLALTGKIEGKRSRGRKWSLWMANLNEWIGERGVKYQEVALFEKARDKRTVEIHDCPHHWIWHIERERYNLHTVKLL